MSELNIYHHELRPNKYAEFYLKYEADKVIEEKDAEIARLKAIRKVLVEAIESMGAGLLQDEEENRHSKYKRCLDNAWGCRQRMELFHELVLEEARTIALPNEVALKEYRRKRERAAKWRKRWLMIAEQFKEYENGIG